MKNKLRALLAIAFFIPVLMLNSCSTTAHFSTYNQKGDETLHAGDTMGALKVFETGLQAYEAANKSKECPLYTKAALTAMQLNDTAKALRYFEKAKYTASENEDTWFGLALCYRQIDNLSKEMDALQTYRHKYPTGIYITKVNRQLFSVYVESENDEKALNLWNELNEAQKSEPAILSEYFTLNKRQNNATVCDSLATLLLKENKNNLQALEWKADKYYTLAEQMYQKEMKAYDSHKTRKQYAHLLKQLDVVTLNFKKSLHYYKKLYQKHPKPFYAGRLANIYYRLDDKKKAAYYKSIAKQ